MNRLITLLKQEQSQDGSWRYCFEGGIMTDAYMIILLRTLKVNDEQLIQKLSERILYRQEVNGAWKLYHDEEDGNLSATIEAYYALLYSGLRRPMDKNMQAAKAYILSKGGIHQAGLLTKTMLALTGQYPWPNFFVPVEIILLPRTFPVNFFDFVGYARVHMAPILLAADRKFFVKTKLSPDLSELFTQNSFRTVFNRQDLDHPFHSFLRSITDAIQNLSYLPHQVHNLALQRTEQFMRERIEPDGTLYSYFSATFLMIFALLARGYSVRDPLIIQAVKGLKRLTCSSHFMAHVQNCTSTVWDTALISYSLQEAGLSPENPVIQKAAGYLLSRQQMKYGDWSIHNTSAPPSGWGFSDINTMNPDVDDTTASLRALRAITSKNPGYHQAWQRGMQWVLSMQNADGGWPAFEKNTDKEVLTMLPIEGADSVSTDPSTADLTGRTLEFLGNHAGFTLRDGQIQRALQWLLKNQESDGSWYGRWGISYIYGTWAALTGMRAVGVPANHAAIPKAVQWILSIQNQDGGWGESCKSDIVKHYVALGSSTPSQSAWMVDALIAVSTKSTPAIEHGIRYLIESGQLHDWKVSYPTGAGLPGGFYIHYHSYQYIWPLLALSHYKNKFGNPF
ncbi:squalene--hopene cyclase [Aneurinibacillus sp. Ricciae_BoGa-3]|uniref:squalene--hopene cyclase n=1 Tax=Aneurinibacillus sp. Ricciae_BoGa-3 TaxID=3022697 RepID=UPI0023413F29|nr:squalene--hopene cyclase [Aneurinibacillus sp. Ricciae_BoGa-3]WCK56816.1 squalene--hopene cyclase [Aneurinibacillus sp. Ricciae_BoGa-3]